MTRYTVAWWASARDELAELWIQGPDRGLIASAADEIDRELRVHADVLAERSSEEPYFINVAMLRAYFRISQMDRLVEVIKVVRTQ